MNLLDEYQAIFEYNSQHFSAIIKQGIEDNFIRKDSPLKDTLLTLINVFGSFIKKASMSYNLVLFKKNKWTTKQLQVLKTIFQTT